MNNLKNLEPASIWQYFEEICAIPRLSKNEKKIREHLLAFASANTLEAREDAVGNILITRPAAPGMEKKKTVVLQSHLDMVGEKNADHPHNWENDPIIPVVRGEWVTANGTTLGADDGIGIAAQMAILTDGSLKTGKIECLFTVDEETGMTGAFGLKPDFFTGRTLLNLDSEDEGILFIGCAGGKDTTGNLRVTLAGAKPGHSALKLSVTGLRGGHSGDEIHKGLGNSLKIMARLLLHLVDSHSIALSDFFGGNLRNSIPREAFATILIPGDKKKEITGAISGFESVIRSEFGETEKDVRIEYSETETPETVLTDDSRDRLLHAVNACLHGVIAWSKDMPDLVETSTNLAIVRRENDNTFNIITTQRSSVESARHHAAGMVGSCLKLAGASVAHSDGYPGWKPDIRSEILRITSASYRKLFGKDPLVKAIHAGLECGLFYEKFPGIDMVSFGPTIRGAHTPQEMIEIKTVDMFWKLLTDVLISIQ